MLGRIAGRAGQAELLVKKMRQEFAAISKRSRALKSRLRVYCEAWPNPRISSPPWVAEIVKICGGEMVLPPGQKVSDEEVADARPDVIVLAWAATGNKAKPEKSYRVSAWKDVPAIRNKHVYVLRDELLNTPGPPLVDGAKQLFRILQSVARRENEE
jgi:iron complex transport system substrate-binding protein